MTWYQGEGVPVLEIDRDQIEPSVFRAMEKTFLTGTFPLYLHGAQGRGKTYAAYYFARHVLPRAGCSHIKWYATPRDLQADLIKDRPAAQQAFRESCVVVLDNFGATSADLSDFLSDELIGLIDRRHHRPLVICSNLTPRQVADTMTPPLVSRLLGGVVVEYPGTDRRIQRVRKKEVV